MLDYTFKPLVAWPKPFTYPREVARFRNSSTGDRTPLSKTLADLKREIAFLGGRNVTIQVALKDTDIRLDGQIRSTARLPEHPGVILAFDDHKGAMSFVQDKYNHWHDNLRSIALTLEALRTVDRYGVTEHGEQYQGFRALPSASSPTADQSERYEAAKTLVFFSSIYANCQDLMTDMDLAKVHYIEAIKKTHPDNGGSSEKSLAVQQAWKTLQSFSPKP